MHFKPCRSQRAGGAGRVARGVARYVKSAAREGRGVRSGGLARSAVALCNRARRRRRRIERDARTPRPHSARGARPAGRAHCGAPMLTTCLDPNYSPTCLLQGHPALTLQIYPAADHTRCSFCDCPMFRFLVDVGTLRLSIFTGSRHS